MNGIICQIQQQEFNFTSIGQLVDNVVAFASLSVPNNPNYNSSITQFYPPDLLLNPQKNSQNSPLTNIIITLSAPSSPIGTIQLTTFQMVPANGPTSLKQISKVQLKDSLSISSIIKNCTLIKWYTQSNMYIGCFNWGLIKVDSRTGVILWSFRAQGIQDFCVADFEYVLVLTGDGLSFLDPLTGSAVQSFWQGPQDSFLQRVFVFPGIYYSSSSLLLNVI